MTTKIIMLAIDLAKGGFQVCAVGAGGAVLYNRVLSALGSRRFWPSNRLAWRRKARRA